MTSTPELLNNLPVRVFKSREDWTRWLDKNHAKSAGVWMQIAKNTGDLKSVSYVEALEIALCYGWIDGQKKSRDEASWLQKFTPRGPRSIWSKINKAKAEKLIKNGQMQPAGLAAIERAKKAGQWEAAYDSHSTATVPADFQAVLDQNPKARAFFTTLDSNNRYAMLFRLQTAKLPETRARRIAQYIGMLEKHEKIYH